MLTALIRLSAFFGKEIHEVRRQPGLVLSLLLGPFLILVLFGLGYQENPPPVRVDLVIPKEIQDDYRIQAIHKLVEYNYDLVATYPDVQSGMRDLQAGRVDVVEVLPGDIITKVEDNQQASIQFIYNEVNPSQARYLQYFGYTQIEAVNTSLLLGSIKNFQSQAGDTQNKLQNAQKAIQALNGVATPEQLQRAQKALQELDTSLGWLAFSRILSNYVDMESLNMKPQDISAIRASVEALYQDIKSGNIQAARQRLNSTSKELDSINTMLDQLRKVPPQDFVSPIQQTFKNEYGKTLPLMIYFAPGVIALILQHISVTLGALSLVRERTRGSLEFFGVAPVSLFQVLIGKYLAYLLFVGLISAALFSLLIWGLHVPFLGSIGIFIAYVFLFILASIGVGFLVSIISNTETQAVQLSMLVLLTSVFFSGFILPLENFRNAIREISYLIPMTMGMRGFQDMMLRGRQPDPLDVSMLLVLALVTFLVVDVLWHKRSHLI